MDWQRSGGQGSPSSSRRASLSSLRNEVSSGANSALNRSESSVDARTPAQSRLKRLQTNLKEAQTKKNASSVPTSPSTRRNTAIRKRQGSPQKPPSPAVPTRNETSKPRTTTPSTPSSTSVMNRLIVKANRPGITKAPLPPPNRVSLPLASNGSSSPSKKFSLKRRNDSNHNHIEDETVVKRNRVEASVSPTKNKSTPRKIATPRSRSKQDHGQRAISTPVQRVIPAPDPAPVPASLEYDNDIEMTEDVVQDEIANLRENFSIKDGYGLSVTVDESNKLVIKYNDYETPTGSSLLQKRIWKNQIDRATALRIVVDTNILIHGTEILTELMNKRFPNGLNYPIIVIPFVVLEELDKLKTQSNTISVSARRANNYLNEQFSAKNPQLQAQSAIDRQQKVVTTKFADDEILNCCLQVRGDDHKVILLSNDVNLRNKALFTDIQAFSLVAIQAKDLVLDFDNVL